MCDVMFIEKYRSKSFDDIKYDNDDESSSPCIKILDKMSEKACIPNIIISESSG